MDNSETAGMLKVTTTDANGTVTVFETTCPLFVFVETSDPFQDQAYLDSVYGDD